MEKEDLLNRWHELKGESVDGYPQDEALRHDHLQERLAVLHRLNELGEYVIEGVPIEQELEETNMLLRQMDFSATH